jgi:hypothetical protein
MIKTSLHKTEHGSIDLVFVADSLVIQFNGPCAEMLPYCKALCCRLRPNYSVALTKAEVNSGRYELEDDSALLLKSEGGNCKYLKDCQCSIQDHKPGYCRQWHCSPGGDGEIHGKGFLLLPIIGG